MNLELQAELKRRYPKFFRPPGKRWISPAVIADLKNRLVDGRAPFDERGIECCDGWFNLIDRLSSACESEIEALIQQNVCQECWPRVAQIKEKFGTLRFYINGQVSEQLREQIQKAQHEENLNSVVPHFNKLV